MTKESSLQVDNNDGHETEEESSLSMVAKKGSTTVDWEIHSLAKPERCRQQAGTKLSSSGQSSNGRKSKMSSWKKEPSGQDGSTERANACFGFKGSGLVTEEEVQASLWHTCPGSKSMKDFA